MKHSLDFSPCELGVARDLERPHILRKLGEGVKSELGQLYAVLGAVVDGLRRALSGGRVHRSLHFAAAIKLGDSLVDGIQPLLLLLQAPVKLGVAGVDLGLGFDAR